MRMRKLRALFSRDHHGDQSQVAGRAAVVIGKVIHDVGIHSLVNGKVVLDKTFRLRFMGAANAPEVGVIASVRLNTLAEGQLLGASANESALNTRLLEMRTGHLVNAVLREIHSQSPAFRALPAVS
jgi:hypothetical protein